MKSPIPLAASPTAHPPVRSWRAERVARWFDLPIAAVSAVGTTAKHIASVETSSRAATTGGSASGEAPARGAIAGVSATGAAPDDQPIDLHTEPACDDPSIDRPADPSPAAASPRSPQDAASVARRSKRRRAVDGHGTSPAPASQSPPLPETGQVVLLTGASGAGKSTVLRAMASDLRTAGARVIDLARLRLPDVPVVDCLPRLPLEEALRRLARLGLGEAWTYLRTPAELSDGQRWRLRLAVALERAERSPGRRTVLVCDEFAALLDRVTAAVVSRAIRKLIDATPHLSAVLATSHDDVIAPLSPDRHVRCDFGAVQMCDTPPGTARR
jgi:ABC-type lipoprotein export system ATPase subunit